jgi:signal transduction histidine kinase
MDLAVLFNISSLNLDLLAVGVSIAAIGILGFVVFLENPKSHTNRTFLVMAAIAAFYAAVNYGSYQSREVETSLWLLRFVLFSSVLYSFSLFHLFYVFPGENIKLSATYKFLLVPVVGFVALLTLTPLVFSHIEVLAPIGEVTNPVRGPMIAVFGVATMLLVVSSFVILLKKTYNAKGVVRQQFIFVLIGTVITYSLLLVCNLLLPVAFNILALIPFAPIFTLPFIGFTAYAIVRYGLLRVKVLATEILAFILAVLMLLQVIFAESIAERIFTSTVFALVLVFGFLLIRSVFNEVQQREKIEKLAADLEVANERLKELDRQKTEFVSIASHQLRAPLTAIKGYASLLLERSYGDFPLAIKDPLEKIAESSRLMINSIEDFLNISRIELGRMSYDMSKLDLTDLTRKVVSELTPVAIKKGLTLTHAQPTSSIILQADMGKIKQVITNFVDNAIKYTEHGTIDVSLVTDSEKGKARIVIKDTGVGMSKETIANLFEKFTRARGASKINATGTGLGLFVAKQLVEGHKGRVWVESEGEGKGSTFYIELPTK